jgi:hypothetical protein
MKPRSACWLALIFLNLAIFRNGPAQGTNDSALTTTNREQIQFFWRAMEQSNGPVTVLSFGDSMAESWISIQKNLFLRLQSNFGVGGYSFLNFKNAMLAVFAGGAAWLQPSTNWWTDHYSLPAGGSIYWYNQTDPNSSLLCDQVGVFWIAKPEGGVFAVSLSTNGGPWSAPLLNLDGQAPTPTGRYTNVLLARLKYRLRVDGVSGTNIFLGPQYTDNASTGINAAFMMKAGENLNDVFSISTNVLYPILSGLNPQLVIWHMKEVGDIGETDFSNRLFNLEAMWKACVTNGDVVYIGTPYEARDATMEYTPIQNRLVRQASVRDHRAYLDCMTPCISYQWMSTNGFMYDAVHPSELCNVFLTDLVWRELGLFALRVDRRISIGSLGSEIRLTWPTTTNLNYDLLASADLVTWVNALRHTGDGQLHSYTNALGSPTNAFFRLSLTSQ